MIHGEPKPISGGRNEESFVDIVVGMVVEARVAG